jgi:hypothetical protein
MAEWGAKYGLRGGSAGALVVMLEAEGADLDVTISYRVSYAQHLIPAVSIPRLLEHGYAERFEDTLRLTDRGREVARDLK